MFPTISCKDPEPEEYLKAVMWFQNLNLFCLSYIFVYCQKYSDNPIVKTVLLSLSWALQLAIWIVFSQNIVFTL